MSRYLPLSLLLLPALFSTGCFECQTCTQTTVSKEDGVEWNRSVRQFEACSKADVDFYEGSSRVDSETAEHQYSTVTTTVCN